MPAERLPMRKIKEVLRLKWDSGLSDRLIAKCCGISRSTVGEYLRRAKKAGLSWPLPAELDDGQIEQALFANQAPPPDTEKMLPDWRHVHVELRRKHVTLALLWQEYLGQDPNGYRYSQFCHLYREWAETLHPTMRQEHLAGEKLFVDYCGDTVPIVDRCTGEVRQAQIFVATLGASNYTYAESTWTQQVHDWIGAHKRTFAFLGAVPALLVPDNLKSGVVKACRYEPHLHPAYEGMATHYGTAIIPARKRKPRDKAKVENGVLVVERWILAALRNRRFFTLADLNAAIAELLTELNHRPFQKLDGSRHDLFLSVDQPAMRPLPVTPYPYDDMMLARVNIDYHIEIEGHYYSVPYALVKKQVEVRLTDKTIECFHNGKRVASHARNTNKGRHSTVTEHMPLSHQRHREWTPSRLVGWAGTVGPDTAQLVERILESRVHPEQGFRSCLGIMRLAKHFGNERLEAACKRALTINALSYKSVRSILDQNIDRTPLQETPTTPPIQHPNIRGPQYYQGVASC